MRLHLKLERLAWHRLSLTAKIWLSIGIFALGFVFSTTVDQIQGLQTERRLQVASEVSFPAALQGQRSEAAFQRTQKLLEAAVVMQDPSGLDRAGFEGETAEDNLQSLAAIPGLPLPYQSEAERLRVEIGRFLLSCKAAYGPIADDPAAIAASDLARMGDLSARSGLIERSLQQLKDRLTGDLQRQLGLLEAQSARRRWLNLAILTLTLAAATVLVNLTIRHAIMRPLMQAQADLAYERDLLRVLLDNVPDSIYFKDPDGRFIRVNRAQCALLGLRTEDEAVSRSDFDFFDESTARRVYEDEREIVRSGKPMVSKVERVSSKRGARWMTSTKVPVRDADGSVRLIVGVSRDCTDWKAAVEALQKSEESFRCLFAAIPHAVWVYDTRTLEILEVNLAAVQRYGYSAEEFLDLRMTAIYADEESHRLSRALDSGSPEVQTGSSWKHRTKDGRLLDVEIGAHALEFRGRSAVVVVAQDVTERKLLEMELLHAQKLESVGQLAAGIAHEINTPIQYIGDNLRFMSDSFRDRTAVVEMYERLREAAERGAVTQEQLAELRQAIEDADIEYANQEVPKAIAQSLDGVQRVATIVRAMKEFAHPGQKEKAAADLNEALRSTLIVARNEYKYVADVETAFGSLPPVVCLIADMNQVFLNLVINASHAIGDVMRQTKEKGKISIRTWQEGGQAVIAISDTGCGIPDKIRIRVFDPFFTTKPVGKGTGQGLAISRSIVVEKHGGTLRFEPNQPQGTIFYISIPVNPQPAGGLAAGTGVEQGLKEESETDSVCRR
jgi:PAS domain S-box-containing protein